MKLDDYRLLGRSGLRVSPLSLGTMTFGMPGWGTDDAEAARMVNHYAERDQAGSERHMDIVYNPLRQNKPGGAQERPAENESRFRAIKMFHQIFLPSASANSP